MASCPCRPTTDPHELVLCLAPPPGDYEVHIQLQHGSILVVNEEGFSLRLVRKAEYLPFMTTIERRLDPEKAAAMLAKHGWPMDRVLCETIRALAEAAAAGSRRARERLERCKSLVEELQGKCQSPHAALPQEAPADTLL